MEWSGKVTYTKNYLDKLFSYAYKYGAYNQNQRITTKIVCEGYQNFFEEEKEKNVNKTIKKRYEDLPWHKKQMFPEYRKKYYEIRKNFIK